MSEVNVQRAIPGTSEDVYQAVKKHMTKQGSLKGVKIIWDDSSQTGSVSGSMMAVQYSATIEVREGSGTPGESLVSVSADVPYLFRRKAEGLLSEQLSNIKA